jgi:hypothetical protein
MPGALAAASSEDLAMHHTATRLALIALLGLATLSPAIAAEPVSFRSGGSSSEDFNALDRVESGYTFKLLMAAKGSGAYLADVSVRVTSLPAGELMLDTRTEGPLLLAALPPGRYEVTATAAVKPGALTTQKRSIVIPSTGLHKEVMYFDTGDTVSPESGPEYRTKP